MSDTPWIEPELPPRPILPWHPEVGPDRAAYDKERQREIEMFMEVIREKVLPLYFPELMAQEPDRVAALVLRWATGMRNQYEEGIQRGIQKERSDSDRLRQPGHRRRGLKDESAWPSRPGTGWVG